MKRKDDLSRERHPLTDRKIGVFGKGGSGKSTCTVLLARALQARGYAVCVVDADSTNIGLHRAFGLTEPPVPLLDYYGGAIFSGGSVTCPVDDPTPLPGATLSIEELPGYFWARSGEGICFLTAGKVAGKGPGSGCDGPISKIARDLRIQVKGRPTVMLVDFKAGFEDTARGVITGLDQGVVVVDPTLAAIQMAGHMRKMVEEIRAGGLPATRHLERRELVELANRIFREAQIQGLWFVLNRVGDDETERFLRSALLEKGIRPIGTIREEPAISSAWLRGEPLWAVVAERDAKRIIDEMEATEKVPSVVA